MSSSSPRRQRSSAAARSPKASETTRAYRGSKPPRGASAQRGSRPAQRGPKPVQRGPKPELGARAAAASKAQEASKAKQISKARKAAQVRRASKPAPGPQAQRSASAHKGQRVASPPKQPAAPRAPQPKAAVVVAPAVPPPTPPVAPLAAGLAPSARVSLTCEELLARIVTLIHERRGEDVVALDVRGLADYMDFLVIASGRSERQNRSIADGVMRGLKGLKVRPLTRPGPEDGAWICLDFVDVVMHVFDPITRAHYDLENLWGDAPRFPIAAPPASAPAAPAGETLSVYEAGTPS